MKFLWRTLIPLMAAVAFTGFFISLGFWQLDRAGQKEALFSDFERSAESAPLDVSRYRSVPRYTAVRIRGAYSPQGLLLDNQQLDGQVGVHVLTVFEPAAGGDAVLVNRGWLPISRDRRQLPAIPEPPPGKVELTGVLTNMPRPGIKMGEVIYQDGRYPLVPYLERDALSAALKKPLAPQILLATDDKEKGLVRRWRPQVMGPEKHRGYALQWFSLAGAVIIITGLMAWRRFR